MHTPLTDHSPTADASVLTPITHDLSGSAVEKVSLREPARLDTTLGHFANEHRLQPVN